MPSGKMRRATCPHCGKESTAAAMGRHEPICVANPANHTRYKTLMTAYEDVGVTYSEYAARVIEHGAPAITSLRRMTGMSAWDDILAWFGLQPAVAPSAVRVCPCCGKPFKALGYAHHYRKCSGGEQGMAIRAEVEDESAIIEWEGHILRSDQVQAQCLPVYKPHPAKGGGVGFYVR